MDGQVPNQGHCHEGLPGYDYQAGGVHSRGQDGSGMPNQASAGHGGEPYVAYDAHPPLTLKLGFVSPKSPTVDGLNSPPLRFP